MTDDLRRHLSQAAYAGVMFPVVSVRTKGGHDSAKLAALGQRGTDAQWTGQRPYTFSFRVALFNDIVGWPDNLWPQRWRDLVEAFEREPQGLLTHPSRGLITVQIDDWDEPLESGIRNGAWFEFTCTELRGEAEILPAGGRETVPADPTEQALSSAAAADAAASSAGITPPASATAGVSLETTVFDVFAALEQVASADPGLSLRQIEAAITRLVGIITACMVDPAAQILEAHPYRVALGETRSALYQVLDVYAGATGYRTYVVQQPMSLAVIASQPEVYGDASRAVLLRSANYIPNERSVPAGTVLRVPPE